MKKDIKARAKELEVRLARKHREAKQKEIAKLAAAARPEIAKRDALANWDAFSELSDDNKSRGHAQRDYEVGDATLHRAVGYQASLSAHDPDQAARIAWWEACYRLAYIHNCKTGRYRPKGNVSVARRNGWIVECVAHTSLNSTRYVGLKGHYEARIVPEEPLIGERVIDAVEPCKSKATLPLMKALPGGTIVKGPCWAEARENMRLAEERAVAALCVGVPVTVIPQGKRGKVIKKLKGADAIISRANKAVEDSDVTIGITKTRSPVAGSAKRVGAPKAQAA